MTYLWQDQVRKYLGANDERQKLKVVVGNNNGYNTDVELVELRERVAHHQYSMILGVHVLRGQLQMPPNDTTHARTPVGTRMVRWYWGR